MIRLIFSLLFLSLCTICRASPVDLVFDIDQTIATKVHDGPHGDLLADPRDPLKNTVEITYDKPMMDAKFKEIRDAQGKVVTQKVTERYRLYEGMTELMQKLSHQQQAGKVRLSFFSGAHDGRNKALLEAIKLKNGANLFQVSSPRVFGSKNLIRSNDPKARRYRELFKKDLSFINKDLDNIILIDDVKDFAPDHQRRNVLWLEEKFPYPERVHGKDFITPEPELIEREKNKMKWVDQQLQAILGRKAEGVSVVSALQEVTFDGSRTPLTGSPGHSCSAKQFDQALQALSNP